MRRFYWAVQQARKMVRENVLGRLIEIVASESAQLDRTGLEQSSYRNNTRASGGGVLMETGCHLLDEVMFISNAKNANVQTCEQRIWNDYEVETVASGSITLESGEKVALRFTVSGVRPVYQGIALRFESGEIRLGLDPSKDLEIFIGRERLRPLELRHPNPTRKHTLAAFRCEWLHFLEALYENSIWDQQQETGLLTTEVIMQCGDMAKNSSFLVKQ
jgi:predicted dehydrogenase